MQIGIDKSVMQYVNYSEQAPDSNASTVVQCYWTLKTLKQLDADFTYMVLPDACIDVVFDMTGSGDAIVMTPDVRIKPMTLGKQFHYAGVRFKPGVFSEAIDIAGVVGSQKDAFDMFGSFITRGDMRTNGRDEKQYKRFGRFVQQLVDARVVRRNLLVESIVEGMQSGISIASFAANSGFSARQLQRKIRVQTGFSPVQLKRIIRFQASVAENGALLRFADQAHLIKEFKSITGVSYKAFIDSFV